MSIISYFMFGFQMDVLKFFIFAAVLSLALLVSESLGMVFAMICKTADIAIVLASILFIILLSLTGFMTSDMPKYYSWIQDISFMRCAFKHLLNLHAEFRYLFVGAATIGPWIQDIAFTRFASAPRNVDFRHLFVAVMTPGSRMASVVCGRSPFRSLPCERRRCAKRVCTFGARMRAPRAQRGDATCMLDTR